MINRVSKPFTHYFFNANPYKSLDSLKIFAKNEFIDKHRDILVYNKAPGMSFRVQETGEYRIKATELLKEEHNLEKRPIPFLMLPDEASGIVMFASSGTEYRKLIKVLADQFTSANRAFLKYYAVTTFIPRKRVDKLVFHTRHYSFDKEILLLEEAKPSRKQMHMHNIKSHQIEHEVVSYNEELNVALVKFMTTLNTNDGLQYYCIKQLAPILGDKKYSPMVQTLQGTPFQINPLDYKKKPQELNERVMEALSINRYMIENVPLHLHLYEIDLSKQFHTQELKFKAKAPFYPYFLETLERLKLELPEECKPPKQINETQSQDIQNQQENSKKTESVESENKLQEPIKQEQDNQELKEIK